MPTLSIRLSEDLESRLDEEARLSGTTRSELAREVLAGYVRRQERERFMAEMIDEARRLKADPEASRLGEEWLPIENEAMEIAERSASTTGDAEREQRWWR